MGLPKIVGFYGSFPWVFSGVFFWAFEPVDQPKLRLSFVKSIKAKPIGLRKMFQ